MAGYSDAGPATEEMEDQNDHGDNQKYVYKPASYIGEQAQKPENCNDDGYPQQHKNAA